MIRLKYLLFGLVLLTPSCGTQVGSTGNGTVTMTSQSYVTTGAGVMAFATLPTVTEFKICVASVKMVDGEGLAHIEKTGTTTQSSESEKIASDDPKSEIKFSPGLIDLSDGAQKDWGNVKIPTGFTVSKIKIKVKKSKEACGVDYSVRFNGQEVNEDIEFKWKFNPAVVIDEKTNQLKISFATVVAALRQAAEAGTLAHIKDHVEALEGTAEKHGTDNK